MRFQNKNCGKSLAHSTGLKHQILYIKKNKNTNWFNAALEVLIMERSLFQKRN